MIYRPLGRTGLSVSQLGFGAMRLPMVGEGAEQRVDRELAIPMIHRAFAAGVNYIDTAVGYCNRDSQCAVGEALVGWRDQVILSTKNHEYADERAWWTNLEDSLTRLRVDAIDIYNHHGLTWARYVADVEPRAGQWMQRAKEQGMIKHICCSFHDDNAGLLKLVDAGYPAVITLQYNMLDRQLEEGIAYAHEKGIGTVVMGPVAGGRLGATSEVLAELIPGIRRVPELALRFVLANPTVTVALSGMRTLQEVEENVVIAADPVGLSGADLEAIAAHLLRLKGMADLYCSGCGYCLPCPAEVNIPKVFECYNLGRVYGLWDVAREGYRQIGTVPWVPGHAADACVACGGCEAKCPQRLEIRRQLSEAHQALREPEPTI